MPKNLSATLNRHPYLFLFCGAFAFRLATGLLYQQPGYTDAFYYTNVARSLWEGRGFREDYIWIYLANPQPVTAFNNPSNTYWLPLTSVLIWLGYLLSGGTAFWAAQLPIMLISSALAPLAFYIGQDIFGKAKPRYGWLMGLLTIFCGFFANYFALPDNFAPYALFSLLFLLFSYKALRLPPEKRRQSYKFMALAGLVGGLAYLTRVDGVLLLAVPPVALLLYRWMRQPSGLLWRAMPVMVAVFGLTVSPWLLHNYIATGQFFPGGGLKTLFMREYNDFFSYSRPLDLSYYLNQTDPSPDWGISALLASKARALALNLIIVGRLGLVIFVPFFGLGLFSRYDGNKPLPDFALSKPNTMWRRAEILPFLVYLVILYLAMSLLFTFPSVNGSAFHSSGGLIPFVAALMIAGLELTAAIVSRGRLKLAQNRARSYSLIMLIVFIIATIWLSISPANGWDSDYNQMRAIAGWLAQNGADDGLLMSPDPPAYYYANQKPSIMLSSESPETNLAIARRYNAKYMVIVPANTPRSLQPVWENKEKGYPGFVYIGNLGDIYFYRIGG